MSKITNFHDVKLVAFDFDGVFTDNRVNTTENGIESVNCWRSDGIGLSRIINLGIKVVIISTESNSVVSVRAAKLKVPCFQNVQNKAEVVNKICSNHGISLNQTMFVGNDINDIPAFLEVGFPVGVADSYPEIYPFIIHKTKKNGGYGAVREICDLIFNSINPINESQYK